MRRMNVRFEAPLEGNHFATGINNGQKNITFAAPSSDVSFFASGLGKNFRKESPSADVNFSGHDQRYEAPSSDINFSEIDDMKRTNFKFNTPDGIEINVYRWESS